MEKVTYGNAAIVASFVNKSFLLFFKLNNCGANNLYLLQNSFGCNK